MSTDCVIVQASPRHEAAVVYEQLLWYWTGCQDRLPVQQLKDKVSEYVWRKREREGGRERERESESGERE